MSVVSFDEIHTGRDGGDELTSDGRTISRYSRVFRAITNSALDEASVIETYADCPKVGSQYPSDSRARCRRVRPRNESFAKIVWIVTCAYSTEREISENPLNEPAATSWSTANYTRPYFKHVAGPNAGKWITNTAIYPFNPPVEGDDSRFSANVRKNVPGVPAWLGEYRDAINNSAFMLDGYSFGARMAKMSGIDVSEWQTRNDVSFRVLAMRIDLNKDTWVKQVLNDGFYEKDVPGQKPKKMTDGDEQEVTEPWPLDADGKQIAEPTLTNVIAVDCYLYRELNFNLLPLT